MFLKDRKEKRQIMIKTSNLKSVLQALGFKANGEIYEKKFPVFGTDVYMAVNFDTKKLIYPNMICGHERNTGFDKPENFVVFECVNRLFVVLQGSWKCRAIRSENY